MGFFPVRSGLGNKHYFGATGVPGSSGVVRPVTFIGTFATVTASYIYSRDGVSWGRNTFPSSDSHAGIAYGGVATLLWLIVTGTSSRGSYTSIDGLTWTAHANQLPVGTWVDVAWSPTLGLFAAVDSANTSTQIATSPDGLAWTIQNTPVGNFPWASIIWSARLGLFIACNSGVTTNVVMTSPDGVNWTMQTVGVACNSNTARDFGAGFDVFGLQIGSTTYAASADGITWGNFTTGTLPSSGNTNGACFRPGLAGSVYCLTSSNVLIRTDAVDFANAGWSLVTAAPAVANYNGNSSSVAYSPQLNMWAIAGQSVNVTKVVTTINAVGFAVANPANNIGALVNHLTAAF